MVTVLNTKMYTFLQSSIFISILILYVIIYMYYYFVNLSRLVDIVYNVWKSKCEIWVKLLFVKYIIQIVMVNLYTGTSYERSMIGRFFLRTTVLLHHDLQEKR